MRQKKTESRIMEIPRDLMFEIFFRLECKDVVSCRGVCRAWYNLISDPNFSNNYTRFSPFTTLLVIRRHECYPVYLTLIQVAANGEFIRRPIKPKIPTYPKRNSFVKVIGSCNGLVFFLLRNFNNNHTHIMTEQVYSWNPLLGGYVALKEFKSVNKLVPCEEYKLGFVSSTNKIKLLRISFDCRGRVKEAHILTFRKDNKWRKLKDPLTLLFRFTEGTCFNGAYHWVANNKNVDWICTFGYGEEKCGRISKPPGLLQLSSEMMRMTVLNNHLSLIDHTNRHTEMTIWTMKEYGVAESWSKIILLRCCFLHEDPYNCFPFTILPNGNILFSKLVGGLLSLNPKTKQCTVVRFRSGLLVRDLTSYATVYAPRFYALEENGSIQKRWLL